MDIPTIITGTVYKASKTTSTGIGLRSTTKDGSHIRISSIAPNGLFAASTDLRVGDICIAINGAHKLSNQKHCADIIKNAVGDVTITAVRGAWSPDIIIAVAPKPATFDGTIGVTFVQTTNGFVVVRNVESGSYFQNSQLQSGDIIVSINGIVPVDTTHAEQLIHDSTMTGHVVVVVAYSKFKSRKFILNQIFGKDYDIHRMKADQCKMTYNKKYKYSHQSSFTSRGRGGNSQFEFLLLFGPSGGVMFVDISKLTMDSTDGALTTRIRQDFKNKFEEKVSLLNELLLAAENNVASVTNRCIPQARDPSFKHEELAVGVPISV